MEKRKTYHVHVNQNRYYVQKILRYDNTESGVADWCTSSKLKLWFYLRWLNLLGYRKDERVWFGDVTWNEH